MTLGYDGAVPKTVDSVVLSTQHHPDISQEDLRAAGARRGHRSGPRPRPASTCPASSTTSTRPVRSSSGGPKGDAGLTGRKIIIDTYGGASRHGGGAFSGKDPSKVDRSAAYAMRWVAKNAVAAGLADRLEVQVAYAIGKAQAGRPLCRVLRHRPRARRRHRPARSASVFDLRPKAIIDDLDLLRPIYAKTAAYGHFGRELPEFTWERTDRVDDLRAAAGL